MKYASLFVCVAIWDSLASPVRACSSHASTAAAAVWQATGGSGIVSGLLTLESSLIAPTDSTVCVAGVGLGSLDRPLPPGFNVTALAIVIVDSSDGGRTPLAPFSFAPDAATTAALAAGSGSSSVPKTNPLFPGATWFGFSSLVNPFSQPVLGPGEFTAFEFVVEAPAASLPVTLPAQFAGGEGRADGAPIFDGDHPAQYFAAANPTVTLVPEPGMLLLMATSVALFLAKRWKRMNRRSRAVADLSFVNRATPPLALFVPRSAGGCA